ncbi:MAG: FtsQ-type POTRA domain-containing protein [Candidatus Geothermincolales bacterium]
MRGSGQGRAESTRDPRETRGRREPGKVVVPYEEFLRRRKGKGGASPRARRRVGARELWGPKSSSRRGSERGRGEGLGRRGRSPEQRLSRQGTPIDENAVGVTGSRDKRQPRAGARRVIRLFLGMSLLFSLIALVWVYFFSGFVSVRGFEVVGARNLDAGYLVGLSGIRKGSNLFRVDLKRARETLLTEPGIKEARVSRRFPDTIVIQVVEREPLACLVQNGLFYLLDGDGMVFDSRGERPPGVVELRLSSVPVLYRGKKLEDGNVLEVLEALSGAPRLTEAAESAGRDEKGVYLICGGVKVILGDNDELARKESIALGALKAASTRKEALEYVDVRLPDRPVWKPKG